VCHRVYPVRRGGFRHRQGSAPQKKTALEQLGVGVDISKRIKADFEVLPLRRGVERTFSRANRRLSKDYEIKTEYEENMFMISYGAMRGLAAGG
jgi:transposase